MSAAPIATPDAHPRPRPGAAAAAVATAAAPARADVAGVTIPALLVLLTLAAYAPVVDNDFVRWDDDLNLTGNPSFRGLGWGPFRWAWTTDHLGVYQPLSWLLFSLEYQLWGLDPLGYHLTSVLLVCVNTVVLFRLTVALLQCTRTLGASGGSLPICAGLAAGLVAAHPLRVEVVAWASCQPYLPAILCYMLAILAYLRGYDPNRPAAPLRPAWLAAALLLFLAALLFKAVAVSLPAVLVILDVYPLRRLGGRAGWLGKEARAVWLEKLPFAILSLVFVGLAIHAKAGAGTLNSVAAWGIGQRVAQSAYGIVFYTRKMFVPLGLTAYYPLPDVLDWTSPAYLAQIGLIMAATLLFLAMWRRYPAPLAAWAAYLVILAPNLGIVSIGRQIAADRYCYLPAFVWSSGLGLGFAAAAGRLGPRGRKAGMVLILIAQALLVIMTWRQCATWHDTETLFRHALEEAGDQKAQLSNSIGVGLFDEGRFAEAQAMYEEALRIAPRYVHAINNLGVLARRLGRLDEAAARFRAAIDADPTYTLARRNYARLLITGHRLDEAAAQLEALLALEPADPGSLTDLGQVRLEQSRLGDAETLFRTVLRAHPDHGPSRRGLDAVSRKRLGHE